MKTPFISLLIITLSLLLSGCAATYKAIDPPTLKYSAFDLQDGIKFAYKYDVLREHGNYKLAKKEYRNEMKVVAIAITNLTDSTLNVDRDIQFYSGQNKISPQDQKYVTYLLKQNVASYLPYMLLTFINVSFTNNIRTHVYPVGYILGPSITLGNMAAAATANKNVSRELKTYNISNQSILKGETLYGIIGIRSAGYNPISVKIRNK